VVQEIHQDRYNIGKTRPGRQKNDFFSIQTTADSNTFTVGSSKHDATLCILGPTAQLFRKATNGANVDGDRVVIGTRDREGMPLNQGHGRHTDVEVLAGEVFNRLVHADSR